MMDGHNCSQLCVELEGSYNCSCYSGYKLQNDGVTCEGNCTYLNNICSYICDRIWETDHIFTILHFEKY